MKKVFWILEGRLGGRQGPNQEPWDLAEFTAGGITLILSLTERMLNKSYEFVPFGLKHVCLPLPKSAPPLPGDDINIRSLLPAAFCIVSRELSSGGAVIVHCSSGKDRSGLFFAYYLMRAHDMQKDNALELLRDKIPRLLTAKGWSEMADNILSSPMERGPANCC